MLKILILSLFMVASFQAWALETVVNSPQGQAKGLVVIAPAKKYLMKERLFSSLADQLARRGFLTVRFNWSEDTLQVPDQELTRAARDIQYVTLSAQRKFGFQPHQTILISKSFSTKAIDPSLNLAKTHILLTPNCSTEAPFQKTYWNILNRGNTNLRMIISVDDPYCDVNEIRRTLTFMRKPELLATTKGDHNFVVTDPSTNGPSYMYQDLVIKYVTDLVGTSVR